MYQLVKKKFYEHEHENYEIILPHFKFDWYHLTTFFLDIYLYGVMKLQNPTDQFNAVFTKSLVTKKREKAKKGRQPTRQ